MQSAYWCFTLNNYTDDDVDGIDAWECNYVIFGKEVGENGTPHLQGYVECKTKKRLTWLKNNYHDKAHWEKRMGTAEQARDYCKKDATEDNVNWRERGEMKETQQGKRSDLNTVTEALKEHGDLLRIAEEYPATYVKFHKGLQALKTKWDANAERHQPEVIVFWGDTGTGKTYHVRERSPKCFFTSNYKWYDGYDGLSDICFDEFNGDITINRMLRLLDRYPVSVETKGGTVNFNPRRIFITSHFDPQDWYKDVPERYPELWRRFAEVRHYKKVGVTAVGATVTEVGGNTGPPLRDQQIPSFRLPADLPLFGPVNNPDL